MATSQQKTAARKNIRKAQKAARKKRTISKLPSKVRSDLGREGAKAARRVGEPGHAYEDWTRRELYEIAKDKDIEGRSKMGKGDLIKALRRR